MTVTESYSIASDFNGVIPSIDVLESEIVVNSIDTDLEGICVGAPTEDTVGFMFSQAQSAPTITTLDAIVAAHELLHAKYLKAKAIDKRTEELIDGGFTYSAKQFSLSIPSQSKLTAAHQIKDHVSFTYPIVWNTLKDDDTYSIADTTDLDNFYMAAIGTIRAHLDSGTGLKDDVRAAVSVAEVDAVVDSR